MNTLFDKPFGQWRTQEDSQVYAGVFNNLSRVVLGDRRGWEFFLTPPTELFPLIRKLSKDAEDACVTVHLLGQRAYCVLTIDGDVYWLFYWTPSTAPRWLGRAFK